MLIFIIISSSTLNAQEREWEPKSIESLLVDTLENKIEIDDELILNYSKGYFPIPLNTGFNIGVIFQRSYILNEAQNILPLGLIKTRNSYSSNSISETDYLDFKKKFSNDNESSCITNESKSIGLEYKLTPSLELPLQIRASSLVTWNTGILYSLDYSKSFLDYKNNTRKYLEIGNILLEETILEFNLGLNIPIYGAFANQSVNFSSLYTLYLGTNLSNIISSKTNQFLQIGDVKNELRFENGFDTLHIISDFELPTLLKSRFGFEIGLGTSVDFDGYGFQLDLKYYIPLESILTEVYWKQSKIIFGSTIYFGGLL